MDYISVTGLLALLSLSGLVAGEGEVCLPDKAETCLTERATQYHGVRSEYSENSADTDALRALCLSQIKPDAVATCFDQNTKVCKDAEVKPLRDQWATVNKNITDMCMQECPDMHEISKCKNITDTSKLKSGVFERFCSTFNESLKCVKPFISTCKLGVKFYAEMLEAKIMQYWKYICNSGCKNIDETVSVFTDCADPLSDVSTKEDLCLAHNHLKTCVSKASNVCPEYMTIVKFKYTRYDLVEKACQTTTSTTTQSTTTTTTTAATTATQTTATAAMDNALTDSPAADDCLDGVDTAQFEVQDQVNIEHILLILRIESCIHNLSSEPSVQQLQMESLGSKFTAFYHHVKQHGWPVLRDTTVTCTSSQDGSRGCSGHRYGLLQCNSAQDLTNVWTFLPLMVAGLLLL